MVEICRYGLIFLAFIVTRHLNVAFNFSVRDISFVPAVDSVLITVTTDVPCHLYCRLTLEKPRIHNKSIVRRGTAFMSELRYCFTVYEDNEQAEAGDTLIHTWVKPDWPYCTTKYMYFWGEIAGIVSPSTSPIFDYHNNYVPVDIVGDFRGVIESREYWGSSGKVFNIEKVNGDIYFILDLYNQGLTVTTFHCDNSGDISDAAIEHGVILAGFVIAASACIKVSEGIYAVLVHLNVGGTHYGRVYTFKINADGTFGGIQGSINFGTGSSNVLDPDGDMPIQRAGTDVFVWGSFLASGWRIRFVAFHISADGTSVTWAGIYTSANQGTQFKCWLQHISGERYVLFTNMQTLETRGYIFNISDAGVITYISNFNVDADLGGGAWPDIRSCHVSGQVYALGYYRGATALYKIRTLSINADGTLSAIIDTATGYFSLYNVYQLSYLNADVYLFSAGSAGGLILFSVTIADDGVIGAIVDTAAGISGFRVLTIWTGNGNIFVSGVAGPTPTFRLIGLSQTIVRTP